MHIHKSHNNRIRQPLAEGGIASGGLGTELPAHPMAIGLPKSSLVVHLRLPLGITGRQVTHVFTSVAAEPCASEWEAPQSLGASPLQARNHPCGDVGGEGTQGISGGDQGACLWVIEDSSRPLRSAHVTGDECLLRFTLA